MDSVARIFRSKIETARSFFIKTRHICVDEKYQNLLTSLDKLEIDFALDTGYLFTSVVLNESGKLRADAEFTRIFASRDFFGSVDSLVLRGEEMLRNVGVSLRDVIPNKSQKAIIRNKMKVSNQISIDIQRLLDIYPRWKTNDGPDLGLGLSLNIDYEQCPTCESEMVVDSNKSELRCIGAGCGTIRELVGIVFDDSQFYSQEGQKAKSGTFNPNRHFQFWWSRILARESDEELGIKSDPDNRSGEKLIVLLNQMIVRDRKVLQRLTVNDVRAFLREAGRTDLNKNIPLVMKKLTGVGPPHLSESLAVRVENLFTKAIEIGEKIRRSGRINRNYYPYYIYKILEQLLENDEYENKRALYYIYIQSKETVEADDADWEQICLELVEMNYIPTDRNKALQYHPL